MHTDKSQEEKPTGDGNPTAGYTDAAIVIGAAFRIKKAIFRAASWLAIIFRGVA